MKTKLYRLLLSAVLMMCCMGAWADGDWTLIEEPTCSKYGTMQNPANTSELRLVPKLAHQFGDDGVCTVCHHAAPKKYNGSPASSLVTITEENYKDYGLTEMNKDCVMGWTVITTAEEFMKYMNSGDYIIFNAFLVEDIILDETENLPQRDLQEYVFDGTGHTISNVYGNGNNYVGLYNNNRGTIRNLGLISPKIVVNGACGGCICGNNWGLIENCFVIDGNIEGTDSDLYGIANQSVGGKIINCYAISNKGNVGRIISSSGIEMTVTNSYGATTGSGDFYTTSLSGLNANKVNGMTWRVDALHSIPCMMMMSIGYYPEKSATCTEGGCQAHWYCTICNKYFLDACHSQEAPIGPALGHDMKHFARAEATCAAKGHIEHYHCDRCLKNFEDENGTNEINAVIPINPNNHSLTLENDLAHCEWCTNNFSNFVSIDNGKPVWLTKEDDEYFLKAEKGFTLQDGVNYLAPVDFFVDGNFTYLRDVSAVKEGAWQCWYEPFALELTTDVLNMMDVAEVAGVLLDNAGNTVVAFRRIETGWMKENTPYVIRPKDIPGGRLELKITAHQLYSSAETSFYNMSTYDKFTFGGNYKSRHNDSWYTLNLNGQFQKMGEGVNLRGQRFWMTIEERTDIPYEYGGIARAKEFIDFTVLGDEGTTGIESPQPSTFNPQPSLYNLNGQKVKSIQKGQIYILNGKKYIAR